MILLCRCLPVLWGLIFVLTGSCHGEVDEAHDVAELFANKRPNVWGTDLPGILRRVPHKEKVVALTFDACGGAMRNGRWRTDDYDRQLIGFLRSRKIAATLFLNRRWILAHPQEARDLASDPLFQIENHGSRHCPLSVTGRKAYGIPGTVGVEDVIREVQENSGEIRSLTGHRPRFFRSGTAHYDDVAVEIVRALGYVVAGFSVNGDQGATLSAYEVERRILSVSPGDVVLCHMNRPGSGTAEGVRNAVERLSRMGYRFVILNDLLRLR